MEDLRSLDFGNVGREIGYAVVRVGSRTSSTGMASFDTKVDFAVGSSR